MNAKVWASFLTILALPTLVWAQGFGGLGTSVEGYQMPKRGTTLQFPRDHGPHYGYRIEWWYLTSNLKGEDGRDYGVQWTLFRSALKPGDNNKKGWGSPQVWMGHGAITTPENHYVAERRARGGIGQAGTTAVPFKAWIDDWHLESRADPSSDEYSSLSVKAAGDTFSYVLNMTAQDGLVLHGDDGYSVKSSGGEASYYYSQPFLTVEGTLNLPQGPVKVTGTAWLDREWSSQPLAENQTGWDWVSLHFDSGAKLMGFRLRQADATFYTSATYISPDGIAETLGDGALMLTPLEVFELDGKKIPTKWRVELPLKQIDAQILALNQNAWMNTSIPYWEGPVGITGSHSGRGYLEMTGYDKAE